MKNKFREVANREKGQGFVELILIIPVLTLLLAGMVEFGYMFNEYVDLVDSAREGARFGSDIDPFLSDGSVDTDFYTAIVQITEAAMAPIILDPVAGDDIVISFFSVENGVALRYPNESGWSLNGNQVSDYSSSDIAGRLISGAPNSGILLVEVFYHYDQILKMFSLSGIPDPIPVHVYSIMPLSAAEPVTNNFFDNQTHNNLASTFQKKHQTFEIFCEGLSTQTWLLYEEF